MKRASTIFLNSCFRQDQINPHHKQNSEFKKIRLGYTTDVEADITKYMSFPVIMQTATTNQFTKIPHN
jgi:hypothetical protein